MIAHFQSPQSNIFTVERSSAAFKSAHELPDILFKLYDFLSQYQIIQMSSKIIEPFYHSISETLNDKTTMLFNILSNSLSRVSIYNHAVSVWLSQNPPGVKELQSYEEFIRSLKLRTRTKDDNEEFKQVALNFYEVASLDWELTKGFSSKKLEELIFKIVAKTINRNLGFTDEVYSQLLFNISRSLLKEKLQLLNQRLFTDTVWDQLDGTHKARGYVDIQKASAEYFTFAKRFFLVDSPKKIANGTLLKIGQSLVLDRLFRWSNCSLSFFEENLDTMMRLFEIGYSGSKEASNLFQKTERILRKIFLVAFHPVKLSAERTLKYQNNPTYMALDKYFGITSKLEEVIYKSIWGYDIVKSNFWLPVIDWFGIRVEKTKSFIVISFAEINTNLAKINLSNIRTRFEAIKKATIVFERSIVKLVFNETSFMKVAEKIINELFRLSLILRGWEKEKIKAVGVEYYTWLSKGMKRSVKETPKESGEREEIESQNKIEKKSSASESKREERAEAVHFQESREFQKVEKASVDPQSPQNILKEEIESKKEEHFSEEAREISTENGESPQNISKEDEESKKEEHFSEGAKEMSTENGESHQNSEEGSVSEKKEKLFADAHDQKTEEKNEQEIDGKLGNQDQQETQEQDKAEKKKKKKKRAS